MLGCALPRRRLGPISCVSQRIGVLRPPCAFAFLEKKEGGKAPAGRNEAVAGLKKAPTGTIQGLKCLFNALEGLDKALNSRI